MHGGWTDGTTGQREAAGVFGVSVKGVALSCLVGADGTLSSAAGLPATGPSLQGSGAWGRGCRRQGNTGRGGPPSGQNHPFPPFRMVRDTQGHKVSRAC